MSIEEEIKSTVKLEVGQKTIINLLRTGSWINERSAEFFKQFDISTQQYNVLRILRGQKNSATNLCDIHERMISPMSNTTRLIEKLRLKDLVSRVQNPENRRKVDIKITETGLQLLKKIDKHIAKHEKKVLHNLNTKETQLLNELLEKLRVKN